MWRPVIEDSATLQLFFDFYAATKPPLSNASLECLVSTLLLLHCTVTYTFPNVNLAAASRQKALVPDGRAVESRNLGFGNLCFILSRCGWQACGAACLPTKLSAPSF